MQTEEFIPLSADAVLDILHERYGYCDDRDANERRGRTRWPFPGTVELWVPNEDGGEEYLLARALNLSPLGVGILVEDDIPMDARVSIAIHQPEATLFGKALTRHASPTPEGTLVGLQFLY
ncbi:MAG: hypothetical protein H6817_09875 [Phycisphaerales bacterium]|nr:hypothetical protein [Phycisphaerales bacterium]